MSIRVFVDVTDWLDGIDAHHGPGEETALALSAVLAAGFEETQQRVHVQTGSLKASGRMKSSTRGDEWEGEISYGGPAFGYPHNPVRYASEEFGRGEDHNAMSNLDLMREDYLEAMTASVRARLG